MDKITALIVDDSSVMRKIVERSLRQAGIELEKVVEASNGAEALAAVQSNKVELILCDINMPVMDGLEFVRQAATMESAKGIPIVMITTEGSETHVVQALTAGRSRIHPQAFYSRSGERARFARAGEETMSTDASLVTRSHEENWLPILELAVEEVFEIMVGCRVKPWRSNLSMSRTRNSPPWSVWPGRCAEF